MKFLVDYNLDSYASALIELLFKRGWLELFPIQFVTFREAKLSMDSNDRVVWNYAQDNQMIMVTANRNMKDEDSLGQVMREANNSTSFPIPTISDLARMDEPDYRD
jgi:predicted nuclease of predicted toxin-antitoxin system